MLTIIDQLSSIYASSFTTKISNLLKLFKFASATAKYIYTKPFTNSENATLTKTSINFINKKSNTWR